MTKRDFVKALWPIWTIELVITGLHQTFGPTEATTWSTMSFLLSVIVLPVIAGIRVASAGGTIGISVLGGISIAAASIVAVAVGYMMEGVGLEAFGGFALATAMYSVLPQALFGSVGGLIGKRVNARA